MPFKVNSKKLVPAEAMRDLTRGSYEHLSLRLDDAIAEARQMFASGEILEVARVATFKDHVVVGTSDGRYFSSSYSDDGDAISLGKAEQINVPVVDGGNASDYVNKFMLDTVNSLLTGSPESQKENILALMTLRESIEEVEGVDLATLVLGIVTSLQPWKQAYRQNVESIKSQIRDALAESALEPVEVKYAPLYNGDIPEDRFPLYLEGARGDLSAIAIRLGQAESRVDAAYIPFAELISKNAFESAEDKQAIREFAVFAESCSSEIHDVREHVKIAIENEQCAMCLGQIHDALAETLTEYETASLFIERMASRLTA